MIALRVVVALLLATEAASGQVSFGCVCSTDVPFATGLNNSHKLAASSEMVGAMSDTVTLVFQSSESIYASIGVFDMGSVVWTRPVQMYSGANPGVEYGRDRCRHLVWQDYDTIARAQQVFYRNFEYRMMPVNVSNTSGNSVHPDVWADEAGLAHVVWEDYSHGKPRIYYRTCNMNGTVGDTFLVSTDTVGCSFLPSIGMFPADSELVIAWQEVDSGSRSPYSIKRRRQQNGIWQDVETLARSSLALRHPSLDYGSPGESFSAAWEDSSSGNMEAHFEGGNPGGGYPTPGRSTVPVVATLESTWSYLFWQEESSGVSDIYVNLYYFLTGWTNWSLRHMLSIDEDMHWPNCLGALVVWTQGNHEPYKVMYVFSGYPIPIAEEQKMPVSVGVVSVQPNPMYNRAIIRLAGEAQAHTEVEVLDASGRKVRTWAGNFQQVVWDGTDQHGKGLPAGVYFVRVKAAGRKAVVQTLKL